MYTASESGTKTQRDRKKRTEYHWRRDTEWKSKVFKDAIVDSDPLRWSICLCASRACPGQHLFGHLFGQMGADGRTQGTSGGGIKLQSAEGGEGSGWSGLLQKAEARWTALSCRAQVW